MAQWLGYWTAFPQKATENLARATKKLNWPRLELVRSSRLDFTVAFNGVVQTSQSPQSLAGQSGFTLSDGAALPSLLQTANNPADLALANQETGGHYSFFHFGQAEQGLTLGHDHFGAERVFYGYAGGTLWFSNTLVSLLAASPWRDKRELNLSGLHTYLAFSFVAAPHTLIEGIQVIPPQTVLNFSRPDAAPTVHKILPPQVEREPDLSEADYLKRLQEVFDVTMQRWVQGKSEVAVHLSGGLDSSAVAAWLAKNGVRTRAFHLEFAPLYNAEKPYAQQTANYLGLPLEFVPVIPDKKTAAQELRQTVAAMGEVWGDPVTLPLMRGYRAVKQAGYDSVFNGEGGDQLFAGWPNRAMYVAEVYQYATSMYRADGYSFQAVQLQNYLYTFHHFYGSESKLYDRSLLAASAKVELSDYIEPYLAEAALPDLFDRLRWTNFWLKGSQNILPRAASLSRAIGLTMQTPFFDWELAKFALPIPFDMLMRGTQEKYLFKQMLAQTKLLPPEILERQKRGMGVPATDWCFGPLKGETKRLLTRLGKRGLFRKKYLDLLEKGQADPDEIRRYRRLGEKIWQLLVLELWLELFYD